MVPVSALDDCATARRMYSVWSRGVWSRGTEKRRQTATGASFDVCWVDMRRRLPTHSRPLIPVRASRTYGPYSYFDAR